MPADKKTKYSYFLQYTVLSTFYCSLTELVSCLASLLYISAEMQLRDARSAVFYVKMKH